MDKIFNSRLIEAMNGDSQREFAEKTGIKQTTISGWLNAGREPTANSVRLIARATGYSADWLVGLTDEKFSAKSAYMSNNEKSAVGNGNINIHTGDNEAVIKTVAEQLLKINDRQSGIESLLIKILNKMEI